MTLKVAQSFDDISSNIIVDMKYSDDGHYIGILTQNGVLFLKSSDTGIHIMEDYTSVPIELLEKLGLESGLVVKKPKVVTRR